MKGVKFGQRIVPFQLVLNNCNIKVCIVNMPQDSVQRDSDNVHCSWSFGRRSKPISS